MRGDLTRWGPIGVQQPGRAAMSAVAGAAAQRRLKRIMDNRMNEPWRVIGRQHVDRRQLTLGFEQPPHQTRLTRRIDGGGFHEARLRPSK
ncbi:MAG: hypothetical protein ACLPKI_19715 [Streptosporangiaceae bacterium]